jgi:uncharacterized protein involved in exopolysaccharide biosynthesis
MRWALGTVRRDRRLIMAVTLFVTVIAVTPPLVLPRTYSSTVAFVPRAGKTPNGLAGIAAQIGVGMLAGDASQSTAFYVELLRSREMLRQAVDARYEIGTPAGTLVDLLAVEGNTPALRREDAIRELERAVTVNASQLSGVVRLTVAVPDADLALAITNRLISQVNAFNVSRSQTQASGERATLERRLGSLRAELRQAEDRYQAFLERNRALAADQQAAFTAERLQREVALRQGALSALVNAAETIKVDELRDSPAISIVQRPERAVQPDPRGLVKLVLLGLVGGLVLGILSAFARVHWRALQ